MPHLAGKLHRYESFADPRDVLYACIRDDDLGKLQQCLYPSSQSPAALNLNVVAESSNGRWRSPLHFAACMGNIDAVRVLLEVVSRSGQATAFRNHGYYVSLIGQAIEAGHRDIVSLLWHRAEPLSDEMNKRPLPIKLNFPCLAAKAGHPGILQDLLRWQDWSPDVKKVSLELAAQWWRLQAVDELLRLVSYDQHDLDLALHYASGPRTEYTGHEDDAIQPSTMDYLDQQIIIEHLVDAGANPNFHPDFSTTFKPLLVQVAASQPELTGALRTLLNKGANVNTADENGNSALHWLTRGHRHRLSSHKRWNSTAIDLMLSHKADPCIANHDGVTALQLASQHAPDLYNFNSILERCLGRLRTAHDFTTDHGESLLHFAALGGKIATMEMLMSSYRMDENLATQTGWTSLMYALLPKCSGNNLDGSHTISQSVRAARYLLSNGANPVVTTSEGWTPLHALALHMGGNPDALARSLALELIARGAPVNPPLPALFPRYKTHVMGSLFQNSQSQWQKLPLLHWAARHGGVGVVRALIESGSNLVERNESGQTPGDVAANSELLKNYRLSLKQPKDLREAVIAVLGEALENQLEEAAGR